MSNALYGKCPACAQVFLVAKLPMPLAKAANLAKRAACPACGETKGITLPTADEVRSSETAGAA
ncbi:hypothetical protein ELI30_08855 [Rhizobium leguminosarum]|uniref:hypothetical protein n=1 Tax=Rhizobium leguminosarum TaxID=384 RepID=UPI001031E0EA|nr:hypothetical protein [Rhizobium leguminosarum]TAV48402.1 hypothetical protein ELI32_09310 [Rhizobium leguminosarum]TAV57902.1 hypothetical protein ELI31_08840 [Rhizobium leguminosarum]TAV68842.1 hypothetical protein ELI30_08855 [Rhizobium leguminosarum]